MKAEESSTLSPSACERIEQASEATGRVHLHRVAGGHWVNTDNPEAIPWISVGEVPAVKFCSCELGE